MPFETRSRRPSRLTGQSQRGQRARFLVLDFEHDVDLYCGVGAMTLFAAKSAAFAYGVESVPPAIKDAQRNAAANTIKNVDFRTANVEALFRPSEREWWSRFDKNRLVVIVDPPRSGCDSFVVDGLLQIKPRRIVYVSCNPATLARDLKKLAAAYDLVSATPVDMFPQTSHIEVVARLERR
jgi:23S rRNA (uracil1939-C5)-methyltransferase